MAMGAGVQRQADVFGAGVFAEVETRADIVVLRGLVRIALVLGVGGRDGDRDEEN